MSTSAWIAIVLGPALMAAYCGVLWLILLAMRETWTSREWGTATMLTAILWAVLGLTAWALKGGEL